MKGDRPAAQVLACPNCGRQVELAVPGVARCLPCRKDMRPVPRPKREKELKRDTLDSALSELVARAGRDAARWQAELDEVLAQMFEGEEELLNAVAFDQAREEAELDRLMSALDSSETLSPERA